MESLLDSYRESWAQLIEADDYQYHPSEIEPTELELDDGHKVLREDFSIFNAKGKKLECSLYRHSDPSRQLVVYSHSHSGNKAEGAHLVESLCSHFSLLVFDYTGYGYSDKDVCTLGLKEMDDLECIIEHARHSLKFRLIFVWGRSMGAVTALLLAQRSHGNLFQGVLVDSPFSSTKEMLCNVMESIPNFVLHLLFRPLGKKLLKETGHEIMAIDLKEVVPELRVPALFSIAHGDTLVGVDNLQKLFNLYGHKKESVQKKLIKFEGDHASKRNEHFYIEGRNFFLAIQKEVSEMASNRGMDHHFEARRHIAAVHSYDSPTRLKKPSAPPEADDSFTSIAELSTNDLPFKVRAIPADQSLLSGVRGEHADVLRESPRIDHEDERLDHQASIYSRPSKRIFDDSPAGPPLVQKEATPSFVNTYRNMRFADICN